MSDIADFLKNVTHLAPQAFEQIAPDELYDFITLMVTFIGSPKYVKNPYLRATFTKLLCYLVPRDQVGHEACNCTLTPTLTPNPSLTFALALTLTVILIFTLTPPSPSP